MPTMEQAIEAFVKLRSKKDEVAKRHKEEMAPYNERLETLKAFFLKYLNEQGMKNFASDVATVSTSRRGHAKIEDFVALQEFRIPQSDLQFQNPGQPFGLEFRFGSPAAQLLPRTDT